MATWFVCAGALSCCTTLIARFVGPTWGPSGADRTQVGPMSAPWTSMFALEPLFGGFLQRQKQISIALPTHWRTYMQVIHIHHPLIVLEYSCHRFRGDACDLEHFSSRKTSMLPSHGFKPRFGVMIVNHASSSITICEWEFRVCILPSQKGCTYYGSGILYFWRQHPQ